MATECVQSRTWQAGRHFILKTITVGKCRRVFHIMLRPLKCTHQDISANGSPILGLPAPLVSRMPLCKKVASKGPFGYVSEKCII